MRILLIDDDEGMHLFCDLLGLCGHETLLASHGAAVEVALREFKPDAISVDLFLGWDETGGPEGVRVYQQYVAPVAPNVPFVVCSGASASVLRSDAQAALKALPVFRGFVQKPLGVDEFLAAFQQGAPRRRLRRLKRWFGIG